MYTVALLALQNCMYSSITGPSDCLAVASSLWRTMAGGVGGSLFRPTVVAAENQVITAFDGTIIQVEKKLSDDAVYDIVVVPVIFGDLEPLLADDETIGWLTRQGEQGACLCSVCAGAFLLARTGRLNGRKATTHWNLADDFAGRFPDILLNRDKMLIDEGDCITAGGVSAYLDLSLYLAARFGSPELAATLAKMMLIDPARRLQTPYQTGSFNKAHSDLEILATQEWLDDNFSGAVTIGELAAQAGTGERTFMRRFKKATGDTPHYYIQQLRIAAARKLLETTAGTIDGITLQVGYEDAGSFRKLFRKHTGLSPAAYRKKFSCLA